MGPIFISNTLVAYVFFKAIKQRASCFLKSWITVKSTFQTVFVLRPSAALFGKCVPSFNASVPSYNAFFCLCPWTLTQILPHALFHYYNVQVIHKTGCVKGQQTYGLGQLNFRSLPTLEQLLKTGDDLTVGNRQSGRRKSEEWMKIGQFPKRNCFC